MQNNINFLTFWHEVTNCVNKLKNDTRRITEKRFELSGQGTPAGQLFKIVEEVVETKQELRNGKRADKELDEATDILMAWLAFVHVREYSDDDIMWSMQRTLYKFIERGWIEFK